MKQIQLTQGYVACVDDEDFAEVSQYKWRAERSGKTFYAVRTTREGSHRKTVRMHQQITGGNGFDHEDRDGLNNQRYNLRPAGPDQNAVNSEKPVHKSHAATSQYKGVSLATAKRSKPWLSQLGVKGKMLNLGYHATEIEAAKAYDLAAVQHHGKFAYLNFPVK